MTRKKKTSTKSTHKRQTNAKAPPPAFHYCLGFFDLLGMGKALEGQELIPIMNTPAERAAFEEILKRTVLVIKRLQERAHDLLAASREYVRNSPLRKQFKGRDRKLWDQLNASNLQEQRWSDGLVYFARCGDPQARCFVNSIYEIICVAGVLSLQGLFVKQPIRGGISFAWGMELKKNEVYGAAVARAYDLESKIAQFPRVVVSDRVEEFLNALAEEQGTDPFTETDRNLAMLCKSLLKRDAKGVLFVDYLGENFVRYISHTQHASLYSGARQFVVDELDRFRKEGDQKLEARYVQLLEYFDQNPPPAFLLDSTS